MRPAEKSAKRFGDWVVKNGGALLDPTNAYEYARFRAEGNLCIIYMNKHGTLTSFQGEDCQSIHQAFKLRARRDLAEKARVFPKDLWRDRGEAVACISEVLKRERPHIAIRPFCRQNNLSVRVLALLACKNGLVLTGHRFVRRAA